MTVYKTRTILKESIPILVVLVIFETFGGLTLNSRLSSFVKFPLFLALIPVINGLFGNIAAVLSTRLSSALHTGYIKPKLSGKRLRTNIYTVLILSFITLLFFCLLLSAISFVPSLKINIPVMKLIIIMVATGIMLTITASLFAVVISIVAFRKKIDPDNVAIPVVTTTVDLLGICFLVLMMWIVKI
jgi:mgtE-like transporter